LSHFCHLFFLKHCNVIFCMNFYIYYKKYINENHNLAWRIIYEQILHINTYMDMHDLMYWEILNCIYVCAATGKTLGNTNLGQFNQWSYNKQNMQVRWGNNFSKGQYSSLLYSGWKVQLQSGKRFFSLDSGRLQRLSRGWDCLPRCPAKAVWSLITSLHLMLISRICGLFFHNPLCHHNMAGNNPHVLRYHSPAAVSASCVCLKKLTPDSRLKLGKLS
jgi:hypothetical protein